MFIVIGNIDAVPVSPLKDAVMMSPAAACNVVPEEASLSNGT